MINNENLFLNTIQFPRKIADKIEQAATNGPWWYLPDCAHPIGHELQSDTNPYFSCTLIRDRIPQLEVIKNYDLSFFSKYIRLEKHTIARAHVTFHWPRPENFGIPHNFHIDQQFPHIVALYYVNDADGDTFFFDNHGQEIHRETPERGKMVIFDGSTYHSSSPPSKNVRMTLNINYANKK